MDEPTIPDHPLRQQAEADLSRVISEIVTLTGLPSRWRGTVEVQAFDFPYRGQKQRACSISLRHDVLLSPEERWTTMIHEGVHSVSAVSSPGRLNPTHQRWEEAIAEQLQRLLRGPLLSALGVTLDLDVLTELDAEHQYNADIRALEVCREALVREARDFYLELLASTADGRASVIVLASRAYRAQREGER